MNSVKVSNNMISRMPVYLNYIKGLPENTKNISATKIANALGLGEVSVRKDLAKVSDGGRCKLGYRCDELINDIEKFLDVKSSMNAIVVGKGELIPFLLHYEGFEISGLNILAGFCLACDEVHQNGGKKICPIDMLEDYCSVREIKLGIIAAPAENAQQVCDQLVALGIKAIWNFTPVHLKVPKQVAVQNENIATSIVKLRMQMKEKNEIV